MESIIGRQAPMLNAPKNVGPTPHTQAWMVKQTKIQQLEAAVAEATALKKKEYLEQGKSTTVTVVPGYSPFLGEDKEKADKILEDFSKGYIDFDGLANQLDELSGARTNINTDDAEGFSYTKEVNSKVSDGFTLAGAVLSFLPQEGGGNQGNFKYIKTTTKFVKGVSALSYIPAAVGTGYAVSDYINSNGSGKATGKYLYELTKYLSPVVVGIEVGSAVSPGVGTAAGAATGLLFMIGEAGYDGVKYIDKKGSEFENYIRNIYKY